MHRLALWTLRTLALLGLLVLLYQGSRGLGPAGLLIGLWGLGEILHRVTDLLKQVVETNREVKALLLLEESHGDKGAPQLSQGA